ncbi:MAG: class I SAM-dependent methyltransferase [Bacteroidia bacterium]|nr:class I SAM-dependent methyltransferase [Bacteroidia bacterium]
MFHFLLKHIPRPILIRLSYIVKFFAPVIYYGKKYKDPIDGKTYRKFLPYGYSEKSKRKNVLSPGTLSLERHRLLWLFLKNKTNFFNDHLKVLHIAPEQCFLPIFKKMPNLEYITADIESPIADLHFDLHHSPLPDNSFDVILANHVLEHVEDDIQCMRELYRMMKPGGWGIFQVPQDTTRLTTYEDKNIKTPEEREKHFWQKDHVRLYGLDYPERLKSVGFIVEEYDYTKEFSDQEIDYYRLPKGEKIYLCKKPI